MKQSCSPRRRARPTTSSAGVAFLAPACRRTSGRAYPSISSAHSGRADSQPPGIKLEFPAFAVFVSDIGKRLGRRIRDLRTQRMERWTQEELAERAQISVSFLSMIERGERIPHVETLAAIANALGVTLSELFAGTDREIEEHQDVLRPLEEFIRARGLTPRDVDKLLGVA